MKLTTAIRSKLNTPTAQTALKFGIPVALAAGSFLVPELALADAAAEVDAAIAAGETLVGKLAPGLIAITALMTGVYLVVSALKK